MWERRTVNHVFFFLESRVRASPDSNAIIRASCLGQRIRGVVNGPYEISQVSIFTRIVSVSESQIFASIDLALAFPRILKGKKGSGSQS